MRTMLGMATATVLALMAGGAVADEVKGTISNIDLTRKTFTVEGKTFTASPNNTVGVKLEELKDGDTVRVDATNIETGRQPTTRCRSRRWSSKAARSDGVAATVRACPSDRWPSERTRVLGAGYRLAY